MLANAPQILISSEIISYIFWLQDSWQKPVSDDSIAGVVRIAQHQSDIIKDLSTHIGASSSTTVSISSDRAGSHLRTAPADPSLPSKLEQATADLQVLDCVSFILTFICDLI